MYLDQVRSSVETGRVVQGIKGRTFLSDLITLPRACVLEYMHLSLEGTVKFLLDLYLNTNNHASNFYLRNSIVHMEHLLAQKNLQAHLIVHKDHYFNIIHLKQANTAI